MFLEEAAKCITLWSVVTKEFQTTVTSSKFLFGLFTFVVTASGTVSAQDRGGSVITFITQVIKKNTAKTV